MDERERLGRALHVLLNERDAALRRAGAYRDVARVSLGPREHGARRRRSLGGAVLDPGMARDRVSGAELLPVPPVEFAEGRAGIFGALVLQAERPPELALVVAVAAVAIGHDAAEGGERISPARAILLFGHRLLLRGGGSTVRGRLTLLCALRRATLNLALEQRLLEPPIAGARRRVRMVGGDGRGPGLVIAHRTVLPESGSGSDQQRMCRGEARRGDAPAVADRRQIPVLARRQCRRVTTPGHVNRGRGIRTPRSPTTSARAPRPATRASACRAPSRPARGLSPSC